MSNFEVIDETGHALIKVWRNGVVIDENAIKQTRNVAALPFVKGVALMPDAHWGNGCTVGSVIASGGAVSPAVVGVDIGCGMYAVQVKMPAKTARACARACAREIRSVLERKIPNGRTNNGGPGDRGAWHNVPEEISKVWKDEFESSGTYAMLEQKHSKAISNNSERQLGTLGTGNHFIEISEDTAGKTWIVLHSGSRGFGNRIGSYFTGLAKEMCAQFFIPLPDPELAYLPAGTPAFHEYVAALKLAQHFAWRNRELMMVTILDQLQCTAEETVHCHHNYRSEEVHLGENLLITRKGAVRAQAGDLAIIPGSMGARTYIARGLGSRNSFCSCSHGAGRTMGRNVARHTITVEQHVAATEGVECYKGEEVLDESPAAYKDIEAVMAAQSDLVTPIISMKQILCVKGL